MCKVIKCDEEPLMDFVLPNSQIDYEKVHKPNFFGFETWKKYLNPMEWFVSGHDVLVQSNPYLNVNKI